MESLETIFLEARALSNPNERASYLAQACGPDAEMRACAEDFPSADRFFEIDGEPVRDIETFRATSPRFDFVLPPVNAALVPGGGQGQGVASGIHPMIAPLSPGNHSIHFRVAVPEINLLDGLWLELHAPFHN